MSDCIFCKIVAGEIPSRQLYADEHAIAFLDIAPWQDGHALVIPRRHVVDALADAQVLAETSAGVAAVGNLLKEKLGASACNVLSSAGADAGQEVFHAHVHVIPRYADAPGLSQLRGKPTSDPAEVYARITG